MKRNPLHIQRVFYHTSAVTSSASPLLQEFPGAVSLSRLSSRHPLTRLTRNLLMARTMASIRGVGRPLLLPLLPLELRLLSALTRHGRRRRP